MNQTTLHSRINRLTLRSLLLVGIIMLAVILGYSYIKFSVQRTSYIESLKSSAAIQVQKILPTLLVSEQSEGLALIMSAIKTEENLSDISFVKISDALSAKSTYDKCIFSGSIEPCTKNGKLILTIPIQLSDTLYGYLIKIKPMISFSFQDQQIYFAEIIVLLLLVVFVFQFMSLSRLTSKEVPHSLNSLLSWLNDVTNQQKNNVTKPCLQFDEFNQLAEKISQLIREKEEQMVQVRLGQMASQVAHDIRSPLSALNLVIGTLTNVSEEKRIIIRGAVNRINDISNLLLIKSKDVDNSINKVSDAKLTNSQQKPTPQLLSPLIDNIVSEKRIQFREKQSVEIESDINKAYGLFAEIDPTEIKRAISNLVNNSIEAFPNERGKVTVSVRPHLNDVIILIQDNGKGIPQHIIKKLGEKGVTHGKEGTQSGTGLGVYHAKHTVEDAGGLFEIDSVEGKGTTIKMILKKAKAPNWFVEELSLKSNMTVISLDDDISIHQIWRGRFESLRPTNLQINHLTFTRAAEFKDQVKNLLINCVSPISTSDILYLVDYELLNQGTTGLDIIEEMGIGKNTILVTSRYEEEKIRERCKKNGIRLIPKAMAGFVPIEIEQDNTKYDGILIDDDSLIRMTWSICANDNNKSLLCFSSPDDFFIASPNIGKNSPLYVDSNLENGIKGEEIAKRAFDLGFRNIYLATGYDPTHFEQPMPWLRGIVGKDPFPRSN